MSATNFECIGVNGFAGDRTIEAMQECHPFTKALATKLGLPYRLTGAAGQARDLTWDAALEQSRPTFESAIEQLQQTFSANKKPVLVTPRCATAIATLPVIAAEYPGLLVLYFDAHGDLNTPHTSESSYLGGMPITAALGIWQSGYGAGLSADDIVHIGARDLDQAETEFISTHEICTLNMADIDSNEEKLRDKLRGRPVFIHLDTDVFDPSEVTAEYAVEGGLFRQHVAKVVRLVIEHADLVGVEITELSPKTQAQRARSYEALYDSFADLSRV